MPPYAGTACAKVLPSNRQEYAWFKEQVLIGTASLAYQLQRQRALNYPWGASFQVSFSGDPGVFQVDVQGAEDDVDANYVAIGSITAVNPSYVGRYGMLDKYPKFVRLYLVGLENPVTITGLITR